MASKRPSSLDYSAHLHELALSNWRRALLERNVARAEINARSLTGSHEKLWRFLGDLHLGIAQLCGGRVAAALTAFERAKRTYSEADELTSLPQTLSAHTYLELGSPQRALGALRTPHPSQRTSDWSYWRGLALARLARADEARRVAAALRDPVLAEHVHFELTGELGPLRSALAHVPDAVASPRPLAPVVYALGVALMDRGELDDAAQTFSRLRSDANAVVHWPIPYIRASRHCGDLAVRADEPERAREAYSELLQWWADGEMDRSALARAAQFVKP